jgi:translation initiation factor 1 (eIF-1/SUI1)
MNNEATIKFDIQLICWNKKYNNEEYIKPLIYSLDLIKSSPKFIPEKINIVMITTRNRRSVTIIEVRLIENKINLKKLLILLKKKLYCNGKIDNNYKYENRIIKVIILSGNQRNDVIKLLLKEKICSKDMI